jgi:hypothetical protein
VGQAIDHPTPADLGHVTLDAVALVRELGPRVPLEQGHRWQRQARIGGVLVGCRRAEHEAFVRHRARSFAVRPVAQPRLAARRR